MPNSTLLWQARDVPMSNSRRSVVHSTTGIVASSQPLAAEAGQRILRKGGNAADAAVAVAAALNVTEPMSTGISGDMFCLYFNAQTREMHALNGSGRSTGNLDLPGLREALGVDERATAIYHLSPHAVTVPGAAKGWIDTIESFGSGKVSLQEILTPAIELAEGGFPVSGLTAEIWQQCEGLLRTASPNGHELLVKDETGTLRGPKTGELMQNPGLARTFRTLAEAQDFKEAKELFYKGRIGQAIVDAVQAQGGRLDMQDLQHHLDTAVDRAPPISLRIKGHGIGSREEGHNGLEVWEHAPNGQGLVALMALGLLQEMEMQKLVPTFTKEDHNSTGYLHAVIEALRIAFADGRWWITDPEFSEVPVKGLLSSGYLAERAKLFSADKCSSTPSHGSPAHQSCDTIYFSITDSHGNAISFINSLYSVFGSGIIPQNCGFALQNRGANFVLGPADHPNIFAARKRPYHTIIPAMVTAGEPDAPRLRYVMGMVGGFMQPQGHVQMLMNLEAFGMDQQEALDAPRICVGTGMPKEGDQHDQTVYIEEGVPSESIEGLRKLGHTVKVLPRFHVSFGRGQVIRCRREERLEKWVYSAGSDPRGDGHAIPV